MKKKTIEEQYKSLEIHEHILLRPGRYIGSITNHTEETWVLEYDSMVKKELTWNPALVKLFDEIISNSVDESKRPGSKLNTIKVNIHDDGSLEIVDNGGIPVEKHKDTGEYVPEMVFGRVLAGSNFDDEEDSVVTGQNGEGASLTNIFSKTFHVETCDGKKRFVQTFSNNMYERTKAKITNGMKNYTMVWYMPDYERFGMKKLDEGTKAKIIKRVYDVAGCNPNLKVYLDGKKIDIKSFKDYVSLFSEDLIYEENKDWQVAVSTSEGSFEHVSFVNGTETKIGGTHINYVVIQIQEKIREFLKKKYKMDVKPAEIRNHIRLFINATIVNPRYSSQTKDELITEAKNYKTEYTASQLFINKILKSSVIQSTIDWIEAKKLQQEKAELAKAKKTKRKTVSSHLPANGKNRENCILFITEGDSAISNLINVRDSDVHGGFPLRGKPKNISEMKLTEIIKNKELSELMDVINLTPGHRATDLSYGTIAIMADADEDGKSITALLINFFSLWPELFKEKRIKILMSPVVIAKHGKQEKRFYNYQDYIKEAKSLDGWSIEYNKGLGSLSLEEYDKMINNPLFCEVIHDREWKKSLELAFGKDASLRKQWLMK